LKKKGADNDDKSKAAKNGEVSLLVLAIEDPKEFKSWIEFLKKRIEESNKSKK
jgi:hypothetical protein